MSLTMTPHLVSIQVGLPRSWEREDGKDLGKTGFFKEPVYKQLWLSATQLEGDGQADLRNHGGPDKAVLAYSVEHYGYWRQHLVQPELAYGAFGENFAIAGQTEADVCVGDTFVIGSVAVQVSQPRQPCWKLAQRWRQDDLVQQVKMNGFTGWYFRVLQEGYVEGDTPLVLVDRPYPEWSIAKANRVMHHDLKDTDAAAALANCPLLSSNWRDKLRLRQR